MARLETMEEVRLVCDAAEALCPANARLHAQSGPSATRPAPASAGRRWRPAWQRYSSRHQPREAGAPGPWPHQCARQCTRRAAQGPLRGCGAAVRPWGRGSVRLGPVGPAGALRPWGLEVLRLWRCMGEVADAAPSTTQVWPIASYKSLLFLDTEQGHTIA